MAPKDAEIKYSWDFDVPETPFWSNLEFTVARNFLTCFTSSEVEQMPLDESLDNEAKLRLLLSKVQQKLTTREREVAPVILHDLDFSEWQRLMIAIETMQKFLNLPEEAETIRILMENGKDGKRDMSGVNMMAHYRAKHGPYAEGEMLAREALPFMQNHAMLGPDSPQALGTSRALIACLWKGGKLDEAKTLLEETVRLVGSMGNGKFGKYQEREKILFQIVETELEHWGPEET
jgi:hypothetical protein